MGIASGDDGMGEFLVCFGHCWVDRSFKLIAKCLASSDLKYSNRQNSEKYLKMNSFKKCLTKNTAKTTFGFTMGKLGRGGALHS